jgi:aspartate kinase
LKVMKFGGSVLKTPGDIELAVKLIRAETDDKVVVVSALNGITDQINRFLGTLENAEAQPRVTAESIREYHYSILTDTVMDSTRINKIKGQLNALIERWERVAFGALYTEELTGRSRDFLLSLGERLAVIIIEGALKDKGVPARAVEMDRLGCVTDGEYGSATIDIESTVERIPGAIREILNQGETPVVTGYFGADREGHTTVFGRGGSDYSAAVLANLLDADVIELWKNVDGFMTANPGVVDGVNKIPYLTYREAAELAYFGVRILHPLAIWPLQKKGIPLWIGNVADTNRSGGTWITAKYDRGPDVIKCVAHTKNIGVLKIHGTGVGHQPGVLASLVSQISGAGINIKSVITSQTCIALLLDAQDLERSLKCLKGVSANIVERLEPLDNVGLIGIVGEDLNKTEGVAGRIFGVVGKEAINIEMISSGASESAYYFLVQEGDLERAVGAIHGEVFGYLHLAGDGPSRT